MRVYLIFSTIVLFNCNPGSYAQSGPGLPLQFVQFFKTYNLINPSSIGRTSPLEFSAGNKSLLGDFSSIRTTYFTTNIQLNKRIENRHKQVFGINLINDQEGSYINTNRASILYAFHIPIKTNWTLNAGISAGFLNYAFSSSNISAGGSSFAPTADIGLWLHHAKFNLGISGNQIIPSKLEPLKQTYTIKKYYTLIADKKFILNPYITLIPAILFRWPYNYYTSTDMALMMIIQNNLSVGLTYRYKMGASFSGGLEDIKIGSHVAKMMFSYYSPLGITYYNPQAIEISVQFIPSGNRSNASE
jgi:type IX secretion system PorP/SprF family membrane protein